MSVRQDKIQLSVEINGTKAGATYKELVNQARNLSTELRNLVPGTDAFVRKTEELKKVNNTLATIRNQTKGVAQGVNSLTDFFKKGVAASLAFFSVQQVIQWGKQIVSWAVKGTIALEDMQDKTAKTFGDASAIVEDFAAINAQSLGVTEAKYASLASQIGAMLVPMGFAREEAARMSTEALQLSAALSEWSNGTITVEQSNEILGKALLGQTKGLKQFGISISEADIKARLAAEGQDKLTGAALKQAKAQATLNLITEQSRDAQEEFAASQEDLGRTANRLSSAMGQLAENFLGKLLPGLKSVGNAIAESISPLQQQSDLVERSQDQFNILINTLQSGNLTYEGRQDVINRINTEYKEYLPALITEQTSNEELQKILTSVNVQMEQRIDNLIKEEKLVEAKRRQAAAVDAQNAAALKVAEQERLQAKLAAQRAAGTNEGAGGLGQGQAERQNTALLTEARRALKQATEELALSETRLLFVRNQTGLTDVPGQSDADLARQRREEKIAADEAAAAAREEAARAAAAAEKARQERLKRAQDDINQERQIRIAALGQLVLSEQEYVAMKSVIDLEAENKIAEATIRILRQSQAEELKLRQEIADREIEILEVQRQLKLDLLLEQIAQEKQLKIAALRAEVTDEKAYNEQLKILALESERAVVAAQLANSTTVDSAYLELQNKILDLDAEISRERIAIATASTEEQINIERELALTALATGLADEEEYQKLREALNTEYDIRILQARLKLVKEGTLEALEIQRQILELQRPSTTGAGTFLVDSDFANTGGSSSPGDKPDRSEEIKAAALDSANNAANAIFDVNAARIDRELQLELDSIDAITERKLEAAGEDALLQKKIRADADRDRAAAEKRAAIERKKLATKEAIIQGALAVIEALPNPFAAAAAAIATGIQLATIASQQFAEGGYTGQGLYRDSTGHRVAGVVHDNEWVASKSMVQDPVTGPIIQRLERTRLAKRGFAAGGYTTASTTPPTFESPTSTAGQPLDPELTDLMRQMVAITRAWPRTLKAYVSLTDLESKQAELDYIRDLSKV